MVHKLIPGIFILVEGKPEETYLNHLKERGSNFTLHVERFDGNQPLKMVRRCRSRFREKGFGKVEGDKAFCILDVDYNTKKELSEARELAERSGITLVVSNRCFEVFFLLHYTDSLLLDEPRGTKAMVREYISDYSESKDVWHILTQRREVAIQRSRRFSGSGSDLDSEAGSDIWLLFDYISYLRNRRIQPIYL